MKPAAFSYAAPSEIADILGLLAQHENARILAGGQSLMPMMNFRYVLPDLLIDINNVAGLDGISISDQALMIGAGTRQRAVEFSSIVQKHCPLLAQALPLIGHRQTRNRGTIGGSLAHADPAAELPTVAMALEAELEIRSVRGPRRIGMEQFLHGFMATDLAPDELLAAVHLPLWPDGHGHGFVEFARRHGDFAIVSACALACLDDAGSIARVRLVVAGMAEMPLRLRDAEALLTGTRPTRAVLREVAGIASRLAATTDVHASAQYRQHLAGILLTEALVAALRGAAARPPSADIKGHSSNV